MQASSKVNFRDPSPLGTADTGIQREADPGAGSDNSVTPIGLPEKKSISKAGTSGWTLGAARRYRPVRRGDGRTILVTATLARLLATLPDGFVRVHKSYAVNKSRVAARTPRPGGGRQLLLDDDTRIPVGRTYEGLT